MFPHPQRLPTQLLQSPVHQTVSLPVLFYFSRPVFPIRGGDPASGRMTVPETTVHKQGDSLFGENEVGPPFQRIVPAPARKPVLPQHGNHFKLCGLVPGGLYAGHYPRAFLLRNRVHENHSAPDASGEPPRPQPSASNNPPATASATFTGRLLPACLRVCESLHAILKSSGKP